MCGIFAVFNPDRSFTASEKMTADAIALMRHRGPDDGGVYVRNNVGLGHRRLSIIDLTPAGHQPMFNEARDRAVVFNGEIYNFKDIKQELVAKGHVFHTHCDTEVILHAYAEWGKKCVDKFIGMFAFVIWDGQKNLLWAVRDRLGIKPLYFRWTDGTFIASSEIKPILAYSSMPASINPNVIDAYFTLGYIPGTETMFQGIYKLRPGHHLTIDANGLRDEEYWDFAHIPPSSLSFVEAQRSVDELLQDSIRLRLMSDVPLGVFLSGGLDSSAVVAEMSRLVSDPINTFTVTYDKKYNTSEEAYAQIVADAFHTNHHVFNLKPDNFFESLKSLVKFSEEPIVESAGIALYHISSLARQHAIVLLSGEGSDEVFGGYALYRAMARISHLHDMLPPSLWRGLNLVQPFMHDWRHKKYLDWLAHPLSKTYQGTSGYLTPSLRKEFYTPDFLADRGTYLEDTFTALFDKVGHNADTINKMLYVDTKTWLVDDLLLKADKMTMAASIELRVPFLDHRLVELSASLPSSFKIRGNSGKHILKSIMRDKLPVGIVDRKKMGFPVPTKSWLASELFTSVSDRLLSSSERFSWIHRGTIETMLKEHKDGRRDHSRLLLALLIHHQWQEEYLR